MHLVRPDIISELRNSIHYLRDLFPDAVNRLDLHFTEAWRDAGYPMDVLNAAGNIPRLSFGTWIGGDRDGHPLVTPQVTETALVQLRQAAFELLHREFSSLSSQLTLSRHLTPAPDDLQARIDELSFVLGFGAEEAVKEIFDRHAEEPWRQLSALIALRLRLQAKGELGYVTVDQFDRGSRFALAHAAGRGLPSGGGPGDPPAAPQDRHVRIPSGDSRCPPELRIPRQGDLPTARRRTRAGRRELPGLAGGKTSGFPQ
ncbi:MAG: phosphoenolpyruvate carboxylase [Luteolibacter sp.]